MKHIIRSILMLVVLSASVSHAQTATVTEESHALRTYPFSHPDPVPILARRSGLYPYFTFRDYSQTALEQPWKVIRLENDHVRVLILPEAGGKVYGAVEKSTNQEFIYQNDVMKFRQVSLRGPWTSGGIEFNFGIVGHAPSTATPVNYLIKQNEDGSASCIVGTYDLPSRTRWSVEISVPPDGAFFRMRSLWTNPTPFQQSYYAWMNNAVRASEDLQYFFPGNRRRFHGYDAPMKSWPLEGDRDLSWYKNNDFGSHHSHFVMGSLADYYGGYWHDSRFGFGHWAS